jgi:PAS domain S-box-containing protein
MSNNSLGKSSADGQWEDIELLRTLIDALPDRIYVKDTEGRYVFSNAAHVKKLGAASPEEVAGKTDFDFEPVELAERYRADEQEILRFGQPLIGKEEPSIDEDGNERWNSTSKVPLRNETGEFVGIVSVTRDVTEGRWVEEALRKSEENLAHAQRIAHLGSWEWNLKTGEVSWSDEAFCIYGFAPAKSSLPSTS